MGNSYETPKKSSAQKGQGMLEYALMMSFVAMVYLIVFADGGFGGAIIDTFDNANETLVMASEEEKDFGFSKSSGGSSSNSSKSLTLADMDSAEYAFVPEPTIDAPPLDWHTIINDIELTYHTIMNSSTPNRAIASEYNLFGQLASMVTNHKEYIYNEQDDLKGWNDLMTKMEGMMNTAGFIPKYKRGNERFSIDKVTLYGNPNVLELTYSDGKEKTTFHVYAENNVMHFKDANELDAYEQGNSSYDKNDSNLVFNEYMKIAPKIYAGGWSYDR